MVKVKQGISRLLDVYTAGLLDAGEFEPRIKQLKERLARLESERELVTQQAKQEDELRLVCSRLDDFAEQINESLTSADWQQRREILRALVKRVEIEKESIRIVYKVPTHPFVKSPQGSRLQHCTWRLKRPT